MENTLNFYGNREIDGKLTATGALIDFWSEISKNWKREETIKAYLSMLNEVLLPRYSVMPLEDYACRADFEKIIDEIQQEGKRRPGDDPKYSEATLNKYRFFVRHILKIAAKHGVCTDVLWGTNFEASDDERLAKEEHAVEMRLPKSLRSIEEYRLEALVFRDPLQSGEKMFTLLMWALGGRPNAVGDLRWDDVRLIRSGKNKYAIVLLTTFYLNDSKLGGKTKNMYRFIPISRRLYRFLMKRKRAVEAAFRVRKAEGSLPPGVVNVANLPICCAGDDYFSRCNLRKARNTCRDILRQIGVQEALFRYFERRAEISDDLNLWGEEKSVTSYILRRNFCTHLYNLCFDEEEIAYLMGHSMKGLSCRRSDMNFPKDMEFMWNKLAFRPIFNPFPDWDERALTTHGEHASKTVRNIPQQNIIIDHPSNGGELIILVEPNEAGDPIEIEIEVETEDGAVIPLQGTYQLTPARGKQPNTINIVSDIIRIYKNSLRQQKNIYCGDDFVDDSDEEGIVASVATADLK